jgi:hypothetical protein
MMQGRKKVKILKFQKNQMKTLMILMTLIYLKKINKKKNMVQKTATMMKLKEIHLETKKLLQIQK